MTPYVHSDGRTLCLGKGPAKIDSRTFKLKDFLPIENPPAEDNWFKGVTSWGMMLNDTLGDCTCFTADTKVPLLDGRTLTFKELVEQYPEEPFYVYSVKVESGKFKLRAGTAHHPRLTIKNAPVYKITLDNGESYKSTRDHKFLKLDGSYGQTEVEQSFLGMYRWLDPSGYEFSRLSAWETGHPTHRMIASEFFNEKIDSPKIRDGIDYGNWMVHHMLDDDGNSHIRDNRPDKLQWMRSLEHQNYHKNHGSNIANKWKDAEWKTWKTEYDRNSIWITNGIETKRIQKDIQIPENWYKGRTFSEEILEEYSSRFKNYNATADPELLLTRRIANGKKSAKYMNTPESRAKSQSSNRITRSKNPEKYRAISVTNLAQTDGLGQHTRWHTNRNIISEDCKHCQNSLELCSPNHKIISIEFAGYEDVYDLTVENYHNFAIAAGLIAHNCASWGHAKQVATLNTPGGIETPGDNLIQNLYEHACGYVPGDPSTDQGGIITNVLNYVRNNKLGKHRHALFAYADPNPGDVAHIKQAIATFGIVDIGLQLPITAQSQVGGVWDVVGNPQTDPNSQPGSWGGHSVIVSAYTPTTLTCITWGALQQMTWNFWSTYVDEAHALLTRVWVEQFGAQSGVNLAAMEQALQALNG